MRQVKRSFSLLPFLLGALARSYQNASKQLAAEDNPFTMGMNRDTKQQEERIPPPPVILREFMHGGPGKDGPKSEKTELEDTADDFDLDPEVFEFSEKELVEMTDREYEKLLERFPMTLSRFARGRGA